MAASDRAALSSARGVGGRIHSLYSGGTVDGPGIRFVVFLQGCRLRCKYCHNPDTWKLGAGQPMSAGQVVDEARKYRSYMRYSQGGVTLTGGEPLHQPDFAAAIFALCQAEQIHTALDTAGYAAGPSVQHVLDATDLVLLDIKSIDAAQHEWLTGVDLATVLDFAHHLEAMRKPFWVRHVLVPGVTLRDDLLEQLAAFAGSLSQVQLIELLPFHQLGAYKWESLGYRYQLADTPVPTPEQVAAARAIFERRGLRVS